MELIPKIKLLRTMRGYSQENMADMIGVSRLTYGDMERGTAKITDNHLQKIAKALGCSVEDIKTLEERPFNFFEKCNGVVGLNNGQQVNNYTEKELAHQIESLTLELKILKLAHEKAELEAKHWKEKYEITKK
jgi:transcriptional regulator with XRE-family HTH domain